MNLSPYGNLKDKTLFLNVLADLKLEISFDVAFVDYYISN